MRGYLGSFSKLEKTIFIVFLIMLVIFIILIQTIITSLEENTKLKTRVYARFVSSTINNRDEATEIIFDEIISKIDFPVIITDGDNIPVSWKNINVGSENITYKDLKSGKDKRVLKRLNTIIKKLDKGNKHVDIREPITGEIIEKIYFGYPKEVYIMKYVPLLELLVILIISVLGFVGIKIIKENENSRLWMGLAREMAHQIGTPTAALMGWIELLEENNGKLENYSDINLMKEDVNKLKIIANRFNKIGRTQKLKCMNLNKEVGKIAEYYNRRSPKRGRGYVVKIAKNESLYSMIDDELFGWAVENIVKNAIDAMTKKGTTITIDLFNDKGKSVIEISDDGRGISRTIIANIFAPGFSTKKYGWGLGLTLTRRIIIDYFGGSVFVKRTKINRGTTFRIELSQCEGDGHE
ncbi:HAMP domain-containing histidine kinase [candidate division WOR-3 bacterium]|uniref:histidine kinase n=1 Tax=candidate division TA06 bacterium TaxID=2250710 RepID=A0A660S776_UNCT6|nr:HAMP domain-containing histidine kinase [candidate division WOR-3 bacterium]RKX65799.1 MAG: hypothetical protein DRP44_05545 [candidate division TA06 bacterium]